jgi:hypothetical protein
MKTYGVNPTHGSIQNGQPDDVNRSTNELAERIVVAAVGVITAVGAFFALVILGSSLPIAAGVAILVGSSISLMIYLNFQNKKNNPHPIDAQSQQINREIDRQRQQNADLGRELQEQKARREPEAVAYIKKSVEQFNIEKAALIENFRNRNLNDPLMRQVYETQLHAINCTYNLAFLCAVGRLSPDAKARVLAPYQAEYSQLMNF